MSKNALHTTALNQDNSQTSIPVSNSLRETVFTACYTLLQAEQRPSVLTVYQFIHPNNPAENPSPAFREAYKQWLRQIAARLNQTSDQFVPVFLQELLSDLYKQVAADMAVCFAQVNWDQSFDKDDVMESLISAYVNQARPITDEGLREHYESAIKAKKSSHFKIYVSLCDQLIAEGLTPGAHRVMNKRKSLDEKKVNKGPYGSLSIAQAAVDHWWNELPYRVARAGLKDLPEYLTETASTLHLQYMDHMKKLKKKQRQARKKKHDRI